MTGHGKTKAHKFLTSFLAIGALFGAYCLATVGVSGLIMTVTDTAAQAKGHGGHGGHGGHWGGHGGHGGVHVHVVVGHHGPVVGHGGAYRVGGRYYGGVWYGHVRRFHGGRWWPYGVGSCWAPSPIGFVWICD